MFYFKFQRHHSSRISEVIKVRILTYIYVYNYNRLIYIKRVKITRLLSTHLKIYINVIIHILTIKKMLTSVYETFVKEL